MNISFFFRWIPLGLVALALIFPSHGFADLQERFFDAIQAGNEELVKTIFIKACAEESQSGAASREILFIDRISFANFSMTPLLFAVAREKFEIVKFLVASGADLNKSDDDTQEWTPLSMALWNSSFETVQFLLEKGASLSHPIKGFDSPLKMAIKHSQDSIQILLQYIDSLDSEEIVKLKKEYPEVFPQLVEDERSKRMAKREKISETLVTFIPSQGVLNLIGDY